MNSAGRVTDASGSESPERWSIVVLVVLLVARRLVPRPHLRADHRRMRRGLSLWPRAVGASEPLDCDEAAYAYIGHRLLQGDVMYRDLTENKPPLGYWLYALAVWPRRLQRAGDPAAADSRRAADDRPGLVDRLAACRARWPPAWPPGSTSC